MTMALCDPSSLTAQSMVSISVSIKRLMRDYILLTIYNNFGPIYDGVEDIVAEKVKIAVFNITTLI